MGTCNSKQGTKSVQGEQPGAEEDRPEGKAASDIAASCQESADEIPDSPFAPHTATSADGSTPQVHKYNSAEKPARSALRPSLDVSSKSPAHFSRKSSSGMSSVGFNVNINAPDAEHSKHIAGADSISLKKIVDMFYDKVVAHPQLGPFFEKIDMQKLKRHQVRFMALAFGGKDLVFEEDPNLNLRKVHYHLIRDKGLTLEHWEMFVRLFEETLNQLEKEIPLATRQAAMRSIHATKHYFVPIGQETEYTNSNIAALPDTEPEPVAGAAAEAAVNGQQQVNPEA